MSVLTCNESNLKSVQLPEDGWEAGRVAVERIEAVVVVDGS